MFTCDLEKTKARKRELENFYFQWYENGKCSYSSDCEPKKKNTEQFWKRYDWSCKIGNFYDMYFNGKELRIAVIGKEGLVTRHELSTPALISEADNRHWKVTFKYLCMMFGYVYRKDEELNDSVLRMMSLTNRFSCLFREYEGQKNGIPNTENQRGFCLKRLKTELDILQPTVILIQNDGLMASCCADDVLTETSFEHGSVSFSMSRGCYIINTSHPCCRKHPWAEDLKKSIEYVRKRGWLPEVRKENTDELNTIVKELEKL